MASLKYKQMIFPFFVSAAILFCPEWGQSSSYAQDTGSRSKNVKGFFQLDLSTGVVGRTVTEETLPGIHAEGDAVSTRVMSRLSMKPWSPLEFYVQAGTADLDIQEFDDFQGDYAFAYGIGAGLVLYEYPGPQRFQLLLQGDLLRFTTTAHIVNPDIGPDPVEDKIRWQENTVQGVGIWRSANWEPYLGARFSWLDSTDTIEQVGKLSLDAKDNFGLVAGSSIFLDPSENLAVNFELTLIDQTAFKVGVRLWY